MTGDGDLEMDLMGCLACFMGFDDLVLGLKASEILDWE
jgi:hypothetical protein